ncbi:MAG TPA: DUF2934 domain-containing protein [Bryobacteraceae bacterium]|jgi:hypothetical protein|nr:DUF2934 domain-containing protein [Bryobacteraceae bacterium]
MPGRSKRGSNYENHQPAVELHDAAAHAHEVGELHGKQEHLTGTEHARLEFEYAKSEARRDDGPTAGHGIQAFGHDEIVALAHQLWEERGRPEGSPDEDWHEAVRRLRTRAMTRSAGSGSSMPE